MTKKFLFSVLVFPVLLVASSSAQFKSTIVTALIPLKQAKATEVTPGRDYDLESYGLMFGLHSGSDEGRFTYVKFVGDFDVSVRLESIHNDEQAFTEAGLMVRKSLHPCDLMVGQSVTTNEYVGDADQYTFMRRTKFGGFLYEAFPKPYGERSMGNDTFAYSATGYQEHNATGKTRPFPWVWLRLTRVGNTYTGYRKENDGEWQKVGQDTVDLGDGPLVGMFISANHHSKMNTVGNPAARALVKFRDLTGFVPTKATP